MYLKRKDFEKEKEYNFSYLAYGYPFLHENYNTYNSNKKYDIFLSYNYNDLDIAKQFFELLSIEYNLSVYADFIDDSINRNIVDRNTAEVLIKRMKQCKKLVYIHSKFSTTSKWCPWEVGLASGLNNFECAILPLVEEDDSEFTRQEYLLIYPTVCYLSNKMKKSFFVKCDNDKFHEIDKWAKK